MTVQSRSGSNAPDQIERLFLVTARTNGPPVKGDPPHGTVVLRSG